MPLPRPDYPLVQLRYLHHIPAPDQSSIQVLEQVWNPMQHVLRPLNPST
jgi:hypothetical protein